MFYVEQTCQCSCGCPCRFDIYWTWEPPFFCSWCEENQGKPHKPGNTPWKEVE